MRRVTYLIDDMSGFEKNLTKEQLGKIEGFSIYYTLEEENNNVRYYLEDLKENKLDINELNGYQKMYLNECYDCFMKKREISDNYKEFIKILDHPREIKPSYNFRYNLFKEYIHKNNINDTALEYMKFIDKFSNEFQSIYNKPVISNQKEFDDFLKNQVNFSNENIELNIESGLNSDEEDEEESL